MAIRIQWLIPVFLLLYTSPSTQISYCGDGEMDVWRDHCYYFSWPLYSYEDAKQICKDKHATLASIHSAEEAEYINNGMISVASYNYWIGMERNNTGTGSIKEQFRWLDGTPVDYENWDTGEPTGSYDCGRANRYDQKWEDSYCGYSSELACKAPVVRGWQEYNGYEYYISSLSSETDSNWYEARAYCMQEGGDLASVLDDAEVSAVTNWATKNSYQGEIWTGLNELTGNRDEWGWSDGSTFATTWSNWSPTYPRDEVLGHLCGYQESNDQSGKWKNGHCDSKRGFLCKRPKMENPTPKTTMTTPTVDGYCPAGYHSAGNKCLKVFLQGFFGEGALSFSEALAKCRTEPGLGSSLASIVTEQEKAVVNAQLYTLRNGVWIGLRRETFGDDWTWVDSSPYTIENWASGEPSSTTEHCVELLMRQGVFGQWNDLKCGDKRGYVCQTYKDPGNVIRTTANPSVNFTCSAGFTPYWYGCYKYQPTALSYESANMQCKQAHPSAVLVGIHAEAENAALQSVALGKETAIWIGLRDKNSTDGVNGEYNWEDGWNVWWTNWRSGQPIKEPGGGCVIMSTDGTWSDDVCEQQYPSICKISQVPPLTTPSTRPGECPPGREWIEYHEHCYFFDPYGYTGWEKARERCQSKAFMSNLVSIHSFAENQMIHSRLTEMGSRQDVWIGLYRSSKDENQMKWTDGSSLQYEAWAPAEPNGEGSDEDCIEMWNQHWPGKWNDHKCTDNKGYVCKAPKIPHVTIPPIEPKCEEGWSHSPDTGYCYWFNPDSPYTFDNSQKMCQNNNSELASIHSLWESGEIRFGMKSNSKLPPEVALDEYWIGLATTMTGEDTYENYWTDKTAVDYHNWENNDEPTDPDTRSCVQADIEKGKWTSTTCDHPLGFVCKKPSKYVNGADGARIDRTHTAGIFIGVLLGITFGNYFSV